MLKLTLSQLSLKPPRIENYNVVSTWFSIFIFVTLCVVSNMDFLTIGAPISVFLTMIFITFLAAYTAYKALLWRLIKKNLWDGKGNLFALIATASLIDLLFPIASQFGLVPTLFLGFFSFAIFFQSIRNAFSLSIWQTLDTITIATLYAITVGFIATLIAGTLGII